MGEPKGWGREGRREEEEASAVRTALALGPREEEEAFEGRPGRTEDADCGPEHEVPPPATEAGTL